MHRKAQPKKVRSEKIRLDQLLVDKKHAQSKERAQALILSGNVLVSDVPQTKPGTKLDPESNVRVRVPDHPYVSRGALKLKKALEHFKIELSNKRGLDIGASTGGFTEILLEKGCQHVFALDVGTNQLAWKIRSDQRVTTFENVNARTIDFSLLSQKVDIIVMDVSFISIEKVLLPTLQFAHPETVWVTLIKPQFEVGRGRVGKGGIVTDPQARLSAIETVTKFANTIGLFREGLIESPITGSNGNIEYLAYWKQAKV